MYPLICALNGPKFFKNEVQIQGFASNFGVIDLIKTGF